MKKLDFLDNWYGRFTDILDDLSEHGFDVLYACCEYIDCIDHHDEDAHYIINLGGTPNTITIDEIFLADEC